MTPTSTVFTPKEVVRRAIARQTPGRVPIYYCNRDFGCSDVMGLGIAAAADFAPANPLQSEWGYVWESLDSTMGQPVELPLADWSSADTYLPPDPMAAGRFDHLPGALAANPDKFIKFGLGITGFNQATFLRGFTGFLEDIYLHPDRAERVLDMVFGFENRIIEQAVRYDIDAVGFADDWGTQNGLIVSPEQWRQVFRPRYAKQFSLVRSSGKKVWFHTCGNVYDIIGDLIDIGVDVIELLQPDIFGVQRLASEFAGKVCFCCSIDHQRRAISGTRDEIFAYARLLNDSLGDAAGGFIAYIEDYSSLGMSEQNYQWIRQAFHGLNDVVLD